jgi:Nif-specific regulatory protein
VPFDSDVRFLTMVANLVGQALRLHKVVAQDRERLLVEQARLAKERDESVGHAPATIKGVIGRSPALHAVLDKVRRVAKSRSTIMLRGETGTGKEMVANAIHNLSPRKNGPFIKLNCAALSESVLESELFGHEKGAFTGAVNQRKGRFELASGGTLFLDEIGEVSTSFQAKLLRVLQEGEFERVGGTRTIKVDVRLVCATNRDLEAEVAKGAFRADLYFRLAVVPIFLPPLRERRDDISPLANEFLSRFNHEHGTQLSLTPAALAMLESCYFPGNVRELENCIRHTATLARSKVLADGRLSLPERRLSVGVAVEGSAGGKRVGLRSRQSRPARSGHSAAAADGPAVSPVPQFRRGQGQVTRGDGEVRLGASQGGPHPRRDAAPGRLRLAQAPHRFEEVLNP